ncbi:MAG: triose-phosphate isomerase [Pseudomonadota bacterium]
MAKRIPLVIGNWKMNGDIQKTNHLLQDIEEKLEDVQSQVAICPPFTLISQALMAISDKQKIRVGAQDVSAQAEGAYTGDISSNMLKELGCTYAIVGHSERRLYQFESNDTVAEKTLQALHAGIVPVICVGESQSHRASHQQNEVVRAQLLPVINSIKQFTQLPVVVAYEPVWAIGTGLSASPEDAQEMHAFIRELLSELISEEKAQSTQILYGGSVKPEVAAALFEKQDIDGGLIGGASLKSDSFTHIVKAAG